MEDYYIDTYFCGITQYLDYDQIKYVNKIEQTLRSNLRNDFELLVNVYGLHQTSRSNTDIQEIEKSIFVLDLTFSDLIYKLFGFSVSYTYRLLQIAEKFIDFRDVAKMRIYELKDYSISKMQELLPLTVEQVKQAFKDNKLTYKSTRAEIREVVKSIKNSKPDTDKKGKVEPATKTANTDKPKDNTVEITAMDDRRLLTFVVPLEICNYCVKQCKIEKMGLGEFIISCIEERMNK